jgi:DNA-binding CsgD family transcriptional regulator
VLVLSQYVEPKCALQLLDGATAGVGYLLQDRVTEVDEFLDGCGTVIDPLVGEKAFGRRRIEDVLTRLTDREREVLACMAQGDANPAIADRLNMSAKTVETHVWSIFQKLDLSEDTDGHRRVLAVLRFLDAHSMSRGVRPSAVLGSRPCGAFATARLGGTRHRRSPETSPLAIGAEFGDGRSLSTSPHRSATGARSS